MPDGAAPATALARTRDLIKRHEGFARLVRGRAVPTATPYVCPAGYWTIGYGHLCEAPAAGAAPVEIEEPAAAALLDQDLAAAAAAVRRLIVWPLSAGQLGALTSWTFNLGAGRLRASTLRQCVNRGELDAVPGELRRWVHAGARILPGLVARREAEAALWISG